MVQFVEDCLRIIFTELKNSNSLYSCILVNRFWCRIAVPILWKNPFEFKGESYLEWEEPSPSHYKLYNTIIYLLPTSSKQLLFDNNIKLPSLILSSQPSFNYISFSSQISPTFINKMIDTLIEEDSEAYEFQGHYKKNLLEQEIYKLFINNGKKIKDFYWGTEQPISQYPGASTFFSKLRALSIGLQHVSSTALFGMAQICQNIEDLFINDCNGDVPGLISFIDIQKNLQSLHLHLKGVNKQCVLLSKVIEKKAVTLKKFSVRPIITLLSPKFLPSLINLQYLELNDLNGQKMDKESVEMQEWDEYLSIASFPNIRYLETAFLPICSDYKLIEKSLGNILEIQIYHYYEDKDPVYNSNLIEIIARNCPKIERLRIDAGPENLDGIKEIFLNCTQLVTVYLSTVNEEIICDKLLEIIIDFSPKSLCEFSFNENWNFSVNGLQTFFENWRGRIPLKFTYYAGYTSFFTEEHRTIIRKYFDEGVIVY